MPATKPATPVVITRVRLLFLRPPLFLAARHIAQASSSAEMRPSAPWYQTQTHHGALVCVTRLYAFLLKTQGPHACPHSAFWVTLIAHSCARLSWRRGRCVPAFLVKRTTAARGAALFSWKSPIPASVAQQPSLPSRASPVSAPLVLHAYTISQRSYLKRLTNTRPIGAT